MNDLNKNRSGYKETKVGWIPEDWECVPLGSVFTQSKQKGVNGLTTYSVTVDRGLIPRSELDRKMAPDLPEDESLLIEKGDITYNMMRMWQGSAAVAMKKGVVSPAYVVCKPSEDIDSEFMLSYFKSHRGLYELWAYSYGITNDRLRLYFSDFSLAPAPLPPRAEQKKITEILLTAVELIRGTTALIDAQKKQKKAIMQRLLSGQERLPGHQKKWTSYNLAEILTESRDKGCLGGSAQKLTVKLYGRGVTRKKEKQVGSDATQYYKRQSGQFIYSKLDFLNGAFGIIPEELDGLESTLDLPAFKVSSNVNSNWLICHVTQENFYSRWFPLANGGRKARRINPTDFKHIHIEVPPIEEQKAIAAVDTQASIQIRTLYAKLDAYKKLREALMQKLLTGHTRVKV